MSAQNNSFKNSGSKANKMMGLEKKSLWNVVLEDGTVLESGLPQSQAERALARACNEDLDAYLEEVCAFSKEVEEVMEFHCERLAISWGLVRKAGGAV